MPIPALRDNHKSYESKGFGAGYVTRDADFDIAEDALSGGQNLDINPDKSISKRLGHTLHGEFMGTDTGIQGLVVHTPQGGTAEFLAGYHTSIMRYVSGQWTALTSTTMTTAKQIDHAYFPLTSKTYIVNGTDNVVKYTSGTAGDQSDSSFKKGKYIVHFKNRLLVANVSGQEDYVWYTDLGVDTFSANNYFRVEGEITGLIVLNDKVLIFTKRKIYVLQNFTFNGTAAGPESVLPLSTDFGAIYDRTIAKVGNLVYFIGQTADSVAGIYATDGLNIALISDLIRPDLEGLAPGQLSQAAGTQWGRFYRCTVTPSGASKNTREYLWDTVAQHFLPPYIVNIGNTGGFSCYATVETSGQLDVYAGSQSDGRVYKLNQANYDEQIDQSNFQVPDVNTAIDAASGAVKRAAQSFQLSVASPRTMYVTGIAVMLKKNAGTLAALTARIETNNSGVPSGTLANANLTGTVLGATGAATSPYDWYTTKFSTPAALAADTTYHLVIQHSTEGTGDSQYYWGMKGSSSTYADGIASAYTGGSWANIANTDAVFIIFTEGAIYFYGDTKAIRLGGVGQLTHLRDLMVAAKATGAWDLQVGVNTGEYAGFDLQEQSLGSNGPIYGSTFTFGSSSLGGQTRLEGRLRFPGTRGKTIKLRFQNQHDNEPVTVYSYRMIVDIINRIK